MAEETKPTAPQQSRAQLEAEIAQLRAEKAARDKAEADAKAQETQSGWWRASQPGHLAKARHVAIVQATGALAAKVAYCARMGIMVKVMRKGQVEHVAAEKATAADHAGFCEPCINQDMRIQLEFLGDRKPEITNLVVRQNNKAMLMYSPKELAKLGYTQEEIALVA